MAISQREIVYGIEEELQVGTKPLKFSVQDVRADGPSLFKVFVDPFGSSSRGLDESLEGSAAWWPGPPKGSADVLSVSAEHDQINLRYLTAPPPKQGDELRIYPPRYLEALKEYWESTLSSEKSLGWLSRVSSINFKDLPEIAKLEGFPKLRPQQRKAFGLLDREFGFLWGPPGTGKTYTLGAMLAYYVRRNPAAKILLLSTTNSAVDLALISVDQRLEELSQHSSDANSIRKNLKRIGSHFLASHYKGREHLLPATDPELIKRIAELETQMPDRRDAIKYAAWKDRISSLRAQIPKPIDQAQLAAMTTTSAVFSMDALLERRPFDLVVFDESSQVSLPHALAIAPLGRKVLFAGDHQQLAPIVQSEHPDARKWLGLSMFKYMTPQNRCFLNEQSRMAEEICEVVSHVFYEGKLVVAEGCEQDPIWRSERRVGYLPEIGTERVHLETCAEEGEFKITKYGKGTRYKSAEYVSSLAGLCATQVGEDNVLILTPYRAQRGLIKTFLKNAGKRQIRVSTVHRAQGSECHTVIFDPVIASGEKLLGSKEEGPRLTNVALSRAKARLILVLSSGDLANEYLRRIAQVISGNGQFDSAVPLSTLVTTPGFPRNSIGTVVRWGPVVGPIEAHPVPGFFYIRDFVTGQRKQFKTDLVVVRCQNRPIPNEN